MTVSYTGSFLRLLFRWKGSIWRSTWKELIVYLVAYYAVRIFYLYGIPQIDNDEDFIKRKFEAICKMFDNYTKLIPLTFLLGFYVSNVVSRWWRQFETLFWPEDLLSLACLVCPGSDEKSTRRRHLIARYVNLSAAIAWRDVSSRIRLRFPRIHSLVDAGLLTEKEFELLEAHAEESAGTRWLVPLHWVQHIVMKEAEENKPQASLLNSFMQELKGIRQSFRKLFCYDWVCVPLPYTQVAALATYAFFFFCLFGRQFLDGEDGRKSVDLHFPLFTVVQFLFFVGWFKIGQDLMRPFGLDDDDIELLYIFNRNVVTSFAIVDRIHSMQPPEEETDMFWKSHLNGEIPSLPPMKVVLKGVKNHAPKLHAYISVDGVEYDKPDIARDVFCDPSRKRKKSTFHW